MNRDINQTGPTCGLYVLPFTLILSFHPYESVFLWIVCKTDVSEYLTIYVAHAIGSNGVRFNFIYMFGVPEVLFLYILIKKT